MERFAHGACSFEEILHFKIAASGQKPRPHTARGPLVRALFLWLCSVATHCLMDNNEEMVVFGFVFVVGMHMYICIYIYIHIYIYIYIYIYMCVCVCV
jgi:hypothetical protein